jgi:vancomycin resistance protein VanJ
MTASNGSVPQSHGNPPATVMRLLVAATHVYYAVVFGWLALSWVYYDRWWWLFLLNSFGEYLFFLIPLPLAVAWMTRRRAVVAGLIGVLIVGVSLYGRLFLPPLALSQPPGPQITVMTSNVLGHNTHPETVIASIRAADADVVALQELNPEIAAAIQRELIDDYPYQELIPRAGVAGLGVISRYPLAPTGIQLPGSWMGGPQILELAWGDAEITLVNVHAIPPGGSLESLQSSTRERERQMRELAAFVDGRSEPLLVVGDFNVTDRSGAYRIIAGSLQDAWVQGGWGLGHTFPGAASPGSSRPAVAGIPVPKWLVRLDYVFFSTHWRVQSAAIGPWDGVSDHRPVVARMSLMR